MPSTLTRRSVQPAAAARSRSGASREPARVMQARHGDEDGQNEAERAGQHMPLDPFDLLVAVDPALALLRPGSDALGVDDRRGRFSLLAETLPGLQGQSRRRFGPDASALEAVPIAAHRLPGAKVLRHRPPPAALR